MMVKAILTAGALSATAAAGDAQAARARSAGARIDRPDALWQLAERMARTGPDLAVCGVPTPT